MTRTTGQIYEFGPFRVDTRERQLLRHGEVVPLTPKVFDTLLVLVENSGHILRKEELMRTVWYDSIVEDASVTKNVSTLRKALGQTPEGHKYIETIPWRGYRFMAGVREVEAASAVELRSLGSANAEHELGAKPGLGPLASEAALGTGGAASKGTIRALRLAALAAAAIGVLSLVLVATTVEHRAGRAPKSVAVLPFKSLGVEVDDQHLGLGMADTLGVRLSSIKQLIVRPTSAVRKYTDANQDPLKAGREQEVEAVLEGTIHRAKGRIRVTARLLRVEDGVSLWAGSLDDKDEDIFTLQDSIVEKLAGALAVNLTGDERQSLSRHHTESLGAYRAYLKGRHFWNRRTEEGLKTAIGYFNQAIAEDPAYALAYGGLADCYKVLGRYGWLAPEEGFSKAREAVTKALSIDNQSAEIHATLATLLISYDYREHAQAEREFRRAIALNPNYATAHQWYAEYLSPLGRHEEALAEIRRAYELDPVSPIVSAGLAGVLYHARQYDQAIEQSLKTLELDTKLANATRVLSAAYQAQGRFDQAIRVLEDALESSPDQRECLGELGHAYAMVGRRGEARRIIERLREGSTRRHGVAYWVALIHAGLRDKAQALAWLEEAHRERSMGGAANTIGVEPRFDGLRSDSRFADLLRSAGLAS